MSAPVFALIVWLGASVLLTALYVAMRWPRG